MITTFEFAVGLGLTVVASYLAFSILPVVESLVAASVLGATYAVAFSAWKARREQMSGSLRAHFARSLTAYTLAVVMALSLSRVDPAHMDYWKGVFLLAPAGLVAVGAIVGDAAAALVYRSGKTRTGP